jgi:hypothetical protein
MAVYLGNAGHVELIRSGVANALQGNMVNAYVNTSKGAFSFDFQIGTLLTGDFVEFRTTDGTDLSFVAASGWDDAAQHPFGNWYINVDQVGSIRLYRTFTDAVAGESTGRVSLATISRTIPISCSVANTVPRTLGQVVSYELTTDRETVDTSSLGDEFRNQYSTMITGSGQFDCLFDYRYASSSRYPASAELPIYLHNLLLRQQFGAEFTAKLYIIGSGYGQGSDADNDSVWHEITGIVTQAGISCDSNDVMRSTIRFVTTGEIKLRVATVTPSYLLQESGSRIKLQDSSGFLILEDSD